MYSFLWVKLKGGNILLKFARFWADAFFLAGIKHENIYEEVHDPDKEYIFVSNHISYLDIPMMMKAIRGQHIRILGKAEMAKIPVFGFIYKQGVVLVNRESARQRLKSVENLILFLNKRFQFSSALKEHLI